MPTGRPPIDLSGKKEWIIERIAAGHSQSEIRRELRDQHGISVGRSKMVRQLADWEIRVQRPKYDDTAALRTRVAELFHVIRPYTISDNETCRIMESEGFTIGPQRIAKLRKEMGLYKRVAADQRELKEGEIEEVLRQEFKDGKIEDLGKRHLYTRLREKYNVVGRDRIYKVAHRVDSTLPDRRRKKAVAGVVGADAVTEASIPDTAVGPPPQPHAPSPAFSPDYSSFGLPTSTAQPQGPHMPWHAQPPDL